MYVVTFYSYKGGVGRTMALINAAAELARRGRKVLIVDFDLEAPGLTTYDLFAKAAEKPGLVDYITDYQKTLVAPNIDEYVVKCSVPSGEKAADLWVMPAGLQDSSYSSKFHSINWESLYANQSGYLLMENLKAQWEARFKPHYVFIDSRTGHTDVSGICTRQLPNSVVFVFKPNRQNLAGLKQIVSEVRQEAVGPRKKKIETLFLASDLPAIDDENGILERHLGQFERELGYEKYNRVRHSDSLDLVDQVVFTVTHRRTRLAEDYIELTDAIIFENAADRDGALKYLGYVHGRRRFSWKELEPRLTLIESHHRGDSQILTELGAIYDQYGQVSAAIGLLSQATEKDDAPADAYHALTMLYLRSNRKEDAIRVCRTLLSRKNAEAPDIRQALSTLYALEDKPDPQLLELPSVEALAIMDKVNVVSDLQTSVALLPLALTFSKAIMAAPNATSEQKGYLANNIILIEIGLGNFANALKQCGPREDVLLSSSIALVFNYAMAEWGHTGSTHADMFQRVLELDAAGDKSEPLTPNYCQCLALASWVTGRLEDAAKWLEDTRLLVNQPGIRGPFFSCWKYLNQHPQQFGRDISQTKKLFAGEIDAPDFITRAKTLSGSEIHH